MSRKQPKPSPVAFEGDSQLTWFEGNLEAYCEDRCDEPLGAEADRPHGITYKRPTRS